MFQKGCTLQNNVSWCCYMKLNLVLLDSDQGGIQLGRPQAEGGRGLKIAYNCGQGGWGGLSSEDVLKAARRANLFPLNSMVQCQCFLQKNMSNTGLKSWTMSWRTEYHLTKPMLSLALKLFKFVRNFKQQFFF